MEAFAAMGGKLDIMGESEKGSEEEGCNCYEEGCHGLYCGQKTRLGREREDESQGVRKRDSSIRISIQQSGVMHTQHLCTSVQIVGYANEI